MIPANFPYDQLALGAPTEARKLEAYCRRFAASPRGEGHFILACYAAFPLVMNADLLYKLWMNFGKYHAAENKTTHIPAVAVSDLLLSPLFTPIGEDLFQMPAALRSAFLSYLSVLNLPGADNPWRLHTLEDLAQFMLQYLEKYYQLETPAAAAYREVEEWSAIAFLHPELARRKLLDALTREEAPRSHADQLRLALAAEQLAEQERAVNPEAKGFEAFSSFAEGWKAYLAGRRLHALQAFAQAQGELVALPAPQVLYDSLQTSRPRDDQGRLSVLCVAIDRYQNHSFRLSGCVNDAQMLHDFLQSEWSGDARPVSINLLRDEEATRDRVLDTWSEMLLNARRDDTLVFHFGGHAEKDERGNGEGRAAELICHDHNPSTRAGAISERELSRLARQLAHNHPTIVFILDTHAGTPGWLDPRNPNHIVLAACRVDQTANEIQIEGRAHGLFTYHLVEALRASKGRVTYRRLFHEVQHAVREAQPNQNPQLFGAPRAAHRLFFSARDNEAPRLQELLRQTGYYRGVIDGIHGPQTQQAVESFRRDYALDETEDLLLALEQKALLGDSARVDALIVAGPHQEWIVGQVLEALREWPVLELEILPPDSFARDNRKMR
jgi:hypothetical protein